MTGGIVVLTNKQHSTTKESVGTIGGDRTPGFILLGSRATGGEDEYMFEAFKHKRHLREALVTEFLALRERFTREGGLVDRDIDSLDETTVGGEDITNLEGDDVAGYEIGGLNLLPVGLRLGGENVH